MIDLSMIHMIQNMYYTGNEQFPPTSTSLSRSFGCSKIYYYSGYLPHYTFPVVSFFNTLDVLLIQPFQNLNKKPCF